MDFDRPGTSSGGRPRTSGRPGTARPGTSTGLATNNDGTVPAFGQIGAGAGAGQSHHAPAFGFAHTPNVPSSRPGTNGGRRTARGGQGSRAGTAFSFRSVALNQDGIDYVYEEDEWDDDDSDDGMVFAFMPPPLEPEPQPVRNDVDPHIGGSRKASVPESPAMSTVITSPQVAVQIGREEQDPAAAVEEEEEEEEEEVFYYDERTGAVYDSAGKLVETDADFDAQEVIGDAVKKRVPSRGSTPKNAIAPAAGAGAAASRDIIAPSSRGGAALEPVQEEASLYSLDRRPSEATLASTMPKAAAAAAASSSSLAPLQHRKGSSTTLRNVVAERGARSVRAHETHIELQPYGQIPAGSSDTFFEPAQPSGERQPAGQHKAATAPGSTFDGYIEDGFSRSGLDSFFSVKATYKGASTADYNASKAAGKAARQRAAPPIEIGSRGLRLVNLEMADPLEDSPFPEVRFSVSNVDDPDMPVSTFRCWMLGLIMCTICGAANTFFNFRFPAPQVAPLVLMLIVYPMGKLAAATLPYKVWKLPRWLGGFHFTLNAGFFNIKEHSTIAQMANVAIGQAYAINAIVVQDSPVFYHNAKPMGFAILFTLSSVCFAFGLAGMCKRFLVWPASMIWPQNLVVCTLLNTLHAEEDSIKKDGRMSRYRYFMIVAVGAFCWNFVPNFLFTALSAFNWVCWIAPTNIYVNTLFGVNNGLGMSVLTFDWVQISYIGAPMITPWWATCNLMGGFTALVWLVYPILYFSNTWNFGYFPIMGSSSYDRFGKRYQLSAVINPDTLELDRQKYEAYSPLYIAVNYYVVYWAGLAMATAMLVHTALYHGKAVLTGIKKGKVESDDIHATMMRKYKEVPDWWYLAMLVVSFVAAVIAMEVYKIGLPIWALLIALFLPAIYMLPAGFIFATTGQILNINLITELLSGHLLPNKPLPNMVFKAYALTGINSGLTFVQDLKLGHYMKVPPRISFAAQVIGTVWLCIVQIGVKQFMFHNVPNLCHPDEPHHFVCPNASTFFNSSLVWGVIGPKRMFGPGTPYASLYYALLLGALIPIPFWYLANRFPTSRWPYVSFPLIFAGSMYIPPASGINYTSFFLVAFLTQYIARKYAFRWWSRYNFVTSAALDSGTILSTLLAFFVLVLPKDGNIQLNWWGNRVSMQTYDGQRVPWLQAPAQGFGPLPKY